MQSACYFILISICTSADIVSVENFAFTGELLHTVHIFVKEIGMSQSSLRGIALKMALGHLTC